MLELSAYFALVQIWSAISAAAILGAANFVIAAALFVIAARPPAGRELELANEIHGSSVDALQARGAGAAVASVRNDPPSLKWRAATAGRATDYDHHQEPEKINTKSNNRHGGCSRTEMTGGIIRSP